MGFHATLHINKNKSCWLKNCNNNYSTTYSPLYLVVPNFASSSHYTSNTACQVYCTFQVQDHQLESPYSITSTIITCIILDCIIPSLFLQVLVQ